MLVSVPSMISLVYSFDVVSYEKYENPIKILVFSLFIIKSSTLTIYIYNISYHHYISIGFDELSKEEPKPEEELTIL